MDKVKVGMIRPISAIGDRTEEHWSNVQSVIKEALDNSKSYGFELSMVSDEPGSISLNDIILKNILNSEIIICDITCFNPNVMFELGIRYIKNKPLIIINDNETPKLPFDIQDLKNIKYDRDLNAHNLVKDFQKQILDEIEAAYETFRGGNYSHINHELNSNETNKSENEELKKTHEYFRNRLKNLGEPEKAVLKSYYDKKQDVILNTLRNSACLSLEHDGFLINITPPNARYTPAVPFKLNSEVKELVYEYFDCKEAEFSKRGEK